MKNELRDRLMKLSVDLNELFMVKFINYNNGVCFILADTLYKGLKNCGYDVRVESGTTSFLDKHHNWCFYGKNKKRKGTWMGYYHAWCVLRYKGVDYIIDPMIDGIRVIAKKEYNKSLHGNLPSCIFSDKYNSWNYSYVVDDSFEKQYPGETLGATESETIMFQNLIVSVMELELS